MTLFKELLNPMHDERAERMSRWSWLMLPTFAVAFLLTNFAYGPVLRIRGQHEGDLLAMTEDVAGVALEAGFAVLLAAAPLVGVILAIRALRRHAGRPAQAALAANGLLLLLVLYQFFDAIRMSFFAPLD
jgi:hypothetical protein